MFFKNKQNEPHVRSGMTILGKSVYRGPHLYSAIPMIRIELDLGPLEDWPTDRLPDFTAKLVAMLPGLSRHGCSCRAEGGFIKRLKDGTWLGHVIEHVALELQAVAGSSVTRGKTRSAKGRPGVYNVLFAYEYEEMGLAAGRYAVELVASLLPDEMSAVRGLDRLIQVPPAGDCDAAIAALRAIRSRSGLGPSTQALVDAAHKRSIPSRRLDKQSLILLGQGSRQKRVRATITGCTSLIGAELAGNKAQTKRLLALAGLPVPRGEAFATADAALAEAFRIGFPVVVKPLDGNHGRGVTTDIMGEAVFRAAFASARQRSRKVIVERQLPGNDHRILVVGGKVVAVAERLPARVVGDGVRSIAELIEALNADPRRGSGHANVLTRVEIDDALHVMLDRQGLTLESVAAAGVVVLLSGTANLSTGGTAIDRTDQIHPVNAMIAEQAAAAIGLDVAGIDFLSPNIALPIHETGGGIVEVNAAPGLRMHLAPTEGRARDVARPIVDMLFPRGSRSRIPIFAVTGTNGKSTTARMVARILRETGRSVGLSTTSGVYVNEMLIKAADASGPRSARMVIENPTIDVAVLETARGGILREGLGFDRCDVGAVLNVTADHLGLKGIDTVQDLAAVKSIVVESVARRGHSILNFDDPMTRRMARHARGRIVWFSMKGEALPGDLDRHIREGGMAVVYDRSADGSLRIHRDGQSTTVLAASNIPATFGGTASFNIENALAAIAMCAAHGIDVQTIARALRGFQSSFEDNPGRANLYAGHPFTVILDYAHNPASLTAFGTFVDQLRRDHNRVIGMVSIPGDRRDDDIREMGRIAARFFDHIIFREAPDGRGRPTGEVNAIMSEGAIEAGVTPDRMRRIVDEAEAIDQCLSMAGPGDLVLVLPTSVEKAWRQVVDFQPADASGRSRTAVYG